VSVAAQREWFEKDYYKVLGVKDDAAPKDITKAYRKLGVRSRSELARRFIDR
jgi:preprotein translocase subunit Sec63